MKYQKQSGQGNVIDAALAKIGASPLVGLAEEIPRIHMNNSCPMSKDDWGYVTSTGHIFLNPRKDGTIGEWTYVLAHLMLHLGLGHLQEDRIHDSVWQQACDIAVTRFLLDSKIGTPPMDVSGILNAAAADEEKLYHRLLAESDKRLGSNLSLMSHGRPDMVWDGVSRFRDFEAAFADSLRRSLRESIQLAGGLTKVEQKAQKHNSTNYHRAKEWFVSSYPLLGAVAAGFQLVDDLAVVQRMRVPIAAVNARLQELYVNPGCRLSFEEWKFVLAHEFLHAALRHDIRREGRDPILWNVACDYIINGWLAEMGVGQMPEGLLYDEHFKGMSVETVYDKLCENIRYYLSLDPKDIIYSNDNDWQTQNGAEVDSFYRSAIQRGLDYHQQHNRGTLPGNFVEEVRAIQQPPIPWEVQLARWFDEQFQPLEPRRTYARLSRRQSATPDIPRPAWFLPEEQTEQRIFGVLLDTSGSMERGLLAAALGSIASYAESRDVHHVRVVFCDAAAYDQGIMAPDEIAGTVKVRGRGGTKLQPGIDLLDEDAAFPKEAPLLIITDGACDRLNLRGRAHAFLIPAGNRLPFTARGPVFRLK